MKRRISSFLAGAAVAAMLSALLAGCSQPAPTKAPEGSAPPSGKEGTTQKGPQLKLSPD